MSAYRQYMSDLWFALQNDWEWIASFNLPRRVDASEATHRLMEWAHDLQKKEKIQIAFQYCLAYHDRKWHFHLLMIGSGKRNGKKINLKNIDPKKWERKWGRSPTSKITVVDSTIAVSEYLAMHNFEWKSEEVWAYSYNDRLLRKMRINKWPARSRSRLNKLQALARKSTDR